MQKEQSSIMSIVMDMRDTVKTLACKMARDEYSIADYFPIDDDKAIIKFVSNSDGLREKRAVLFHDMMYTVCIPPSNAITENTKKNFVDNVLNAIFTRSYMGSHRWPAHK